MGEKEVVGVESLEMDQDGGGRFECYAWAEVVMPVISGFLPFFCFFPFSFFFLPVGEVGETLVFSWFYHLAASFFF